MAELFEKYKKEIIAFWEKLNKSKKLMLIALIVTMTFFFGYLIIRGSSSNYQALYRDLTAADAGAVVDILEEQNVSYQIESNGSTILVPEAELYPLRLELANQGLPNQGVVGFEIFNSSEFGSTEFEREVNYYRALGGELSRSIQSISGISFARVQISPPEQSLFLAEEKAASASVILDLERGFNIDNNQVQAIQNLVASGVQDLAVAEVTIVDTSGALLSANSSSDEWGSSSDHFALSREFENSLENDLSVLLNRVLGPDNFVVKVNADLNFDQLESESTTFTPVVDDEGIIRSQEVTSQSQSGGMTGGTPGTDSNIPQYQAVEGQESSSESQSSITNYEINQRIERQVYAPGELQRLSVSVIVDEETDQQTIDQIRGAVSAAVAYDEGRGDELNVSAIRFDRSLERAVEEARVAQEESQRRENYIYGGLIIFILVITAGLITFLYRKRSAQPQKGTQVDLRAADEEAEEALFQKDAEAEKTAKIKRELENMVHADPESAAKLLRGWLAED